MTLPSIGRLYTLNLVARLVERCEGEPAVSLQLQIVLIEHDTVAAHLHALTPDEVKQ